MIAIVVPKVDTQIIFLRGFAAHQIYASLPLYFFITYDAN